MHDYLDYLAFRFINRKSRWKGNESTYNEAISPDLQSIDQLCYSSQFYFVTTIYVAGMAQVIIGMQTLLWVPNYSCYADQATLPLSILMFLICVSVEKLCLWCGKACKIWKIDEVLEKVTKSEAGEDFIYLINRLAQMQQEDDKAGDEEIPQHLRFKSRLWLTLDKVRMRDLQMKADLKTDRVMAEDFKKLFLTYNKPWLKENI